MHVFRVGGIGDSLMSTPALRLLKQIRPQVRIVFYTPFVQAFRGLPFLDEVRPLEDCSHPSAVWSFAKLRGVRYINILCGYRDGVVEFLYEGSSLLGGISPESSAISSAWMWATFALPASLTRH